MLRVLTTESTETQRGCSCSLNLCVSVPSVVKNTQPRHHSCGSCYSDAKKSLKLTGVISPPQWLCTAANWVFISDPPSPIGLRRAGREFSTKGLQVRETDWSQVRDMPLPTDARGSLIGLVRYGHRPPEKAVEIDVGSRLRFRLR